MPTVAIVDYGMGNLRSVWRAVAHVAGPGWRVELAATPEAVARADRLIVPGQGAAAACMRGLAGAELVEALREALAAKPFLGICMGLQLLFEHSAENGGTACLGVLPGEVRPFAGEAAVRAARLKIPHMGWNRVRQRPHPLWRGVEDGAWFYFVHSYYAAPSDPSVCLGCSDYGVEFAAAVGRANLFAVQFHPEKSAAVGLRLLANFLAWTPAA